MSLTLNSNIVLECDIEAVIAKAIADNTFPNPVYKNNEMHGQSNWNTSPTIETYQYEQESLILPRGYMRELITILKEYDITLPISDDRISNPCNYPKKLKGITLREYQQRAVNAALHFDQGAIVSPTGSGKTLIGLEIIRQHQQKALILVHRSDLARQWVKVIKERMGLKAGFIGDGEWTIGNEITIAMVQTLSARKEETKEMSITFGLVIVDEMHRTPSATCFDVISLLRAKYRYGLSACPNRRDGLEQMIYRAVGPPIATITKQEVEGIGSTVPAIVIPIETGFIPGLINSWSDYLSTLTYNAERNLIIIDLARSSTAPTLILCDRVAHAEQLSEMLTRRNVQHVLAHGKLKADDRAQAMEQIKTAQITIGTTGLLGEGLDVISWGVLIMASPISSEIKLLQAIGRIVRPASGKKQALTYDLRDNCGFSGASFKKRVEIYKKNKIWIDFGNKKAAVQAA